MANFTKKKSELNNFNLESIINVDNTTNLSSTSPSAHPNETNITMANHSFAQNNASESPTSHESSTYHNADNAQTSVEERDEVRSNEEDICDKDENIEVEDNETADDVDDEGADNNSQASNLNEYIDNSKLSKSPGTTLTTKRPRSFELNQQENTNKKFCFYNNNSEDNSNQLIKQETLNLTSDTPNNLGLNYINEVSNQSTNFFKSLFNLNHLNFNPHHPHLPPAPNPADLFHLNHHQHHLANTLHTFSQNRSNLNMNISQKTTTNASITSDIKLPFIIDYFFIVNSISENREIVKGKCKYCSYEFNCKMKPTSNFSKHAQIHEKLFVEYLKAKENIKLKRATELAQTSSSPQTSTASSSLIQLNNQTSKKLSHNKNRQGNTSIKVEHQSGLSSLSNMMLPPPPPPLPLPPSPLTSPPPSSLIASLSPSSSTSSSSFKLPAKQTNKFNTNFSQLKLENKISKFLIDSLLPSKILDTRLFQDLVSMIGNNETLTDQRSSSFDNRQLFSSNSLQVKYTTQLVPQLNEFTEKRIHELINSNLSPSNDTFCSIYIDVFNDYFNQVDVNDFKSLNTLIEKQNENKTFFVGFTLNIVNQNSQSLSQTLSCYKFTNSLDMDLDAFIFRKLHDTLRKYQIKQEKCHRIIFSNQAINQWQTFKYWSLPGLEMLNEQFFDLDLDASSLQTLQNEMAARLVKDVDVDEFDLMDEEDDDDKDDSLEDAEGEQDEDELLYEDEINEYKNEVNDYKDDNRENNEFIQQSTKNRLKNPLPCVVDMLNLSAKEVMEFLFSNIENHSKSYLKENSSQKSKRILFNTLRKIAKSFYSSTCSQPKSKILIANILKIKNSHSSANHLPRWCQQLLILKKMFKIEPTLLNEQEALSCGQQQEASTSSQPSAGGSGGSGVASIGKMSAKLNKKEQLYLKEFILLLEPLYSMLIELIPTDFEFLDATDKTKVSPYDLSSNYNHQRTSKISKVMPCLKTLLFTYEQKLKFNIGLMSKSSKKLQLLLNKNLKFVYKEPSFRLASLLDPNFGTSFVPLLQKKRLEHFLIENLIQLNSNNDLNVLQQNDMFLNLNSNKYKYIYFDESQVDDQKFNTSLYRDEVGSYLKHIRSLNSNRSPNSSSAQSAFTTLTNKTEAIFLTDPFKFWSLNGKKWPNLARLFRKVTTVHVTSSGVERIINLNQTHNLANHFDSKIIEQILFLKCNQNLN